jgi:hypothetical protein
MGLEMSEGVRFVPSERVWAGETSTYESGLATMNAKAGYV